MKRIILPVLFLAAACSGPKRPFSLKLKNAVESAQNRPPCDAVIALEWARSWPVPEEDGRTFKILFYPITGNPASGPTVYSPAGEAVIDLESGKTLDCRAYRAPPKQMSNRRWPSGIRGIGMKKFEERAAELFDKTEAVARAYASPKAPGAGAKAPAKRYLKAFKGMAEPDLLPDYYRMNSAFWEWLRKTTGDSIPRAP